MGFSNSFNIVIFIYLALTGLIVYRIYQYGFVGYAKKRMEKRQRRVDNLKHYVDDLQYD